MKWQDLLTILGNATLFESSMLLAAEDSPAETRRQLSRWVASGRLKQLRRGLYAISPPHAREGPDAFALASRLHRPSYVSLQSALAYHGVIPEAVPVLTSVTTGRPVRFRTPFGEFVYRHLHPALFWGYQELDLGPGQQAYVAFPEKALIDLFHLTSGPIRRRFLEELRFASGQLDPERLEQFAERTKKPKLVRAAALTARLLGSETRKEEAP
jgi:predicted transcriptional regulator of viral defense system